MSDPVPSEPADRVDPARSFGAVAGLYDRARPSYPPAALQDALGTARLRVADVGAGTGKLTAVLVGLGHEVVAVEPDAGMRAQLQRRLPDVQALAGTGESMPLPDGSVDAVTVAQAFHWMEPVAALAEFVRVLRPGGAVVLVWNHRDETVPWVRAFGEILDSEHRAKATQGFGRLTHGRGVPGLTAFARHDHEWSQALDADGLVELAASRSGLITMDAGGRTRILDAVRALPGEHPDLAGATTFTLPYVTSVFVARTTS